MSNFPPPTDFYRDNLIRFPAASDKPKAQLASEITPGIYAPTETVPLDPATNGLYYGAGARLTGSLADSWVDSFASIPAPVLLHSTSAVQVCKGVVGLAGGVAGDSMLVNVVILKNAGPATLTVGGFMGEDGTPRNMVFTGSSTADTALNLGGIVNSGAAMTLTASVADVVLVGLRRTVGGLVRTAALTPPTALSLVGGAPSLSTNATALPLVGALTAAGLAATRSP